MEVTRHDDPRSLIERAGEFLVEREAEHNLILGLCSRLEVDPTPRGQAPYLASIGAGDETIAVALRTPPYDVVLSEIDDLSAVELLAEDVRRVYESLPGVMGPRHGCRRFAELWQAATGATARPGLSQRIMRAESVVPSRDAPGAMRSAGEEDRPLLVEWTEAFAAEALLGAPTGDAEAMVSERLAGIAGAGLFLWEDVPGRQVSLAGCAGRTPQGIRVGPVYTPPELRGRGYASALTAALTQALLEGGRRFCFLFVDLANPTSNRIYERIGYRPVTEVDEWRFS